MGKSRVKPYTSPTDPFIRFYDQRFQSSYFLSNFYPKPISTKDPDGNDTVFQCSEGLYHASRAPDHWKEFTNLTGPQAWKRAQELKKTCEFDPNKFEIMLQVVRTKFKDQELATLLLKTGSSYLVERTKDIFWGDGLTGEGENSLGKICMIVRKELGGTGIVEPPPEYAEFVRNNPKKA